MSQRRACRVIRIDRASVSYEATRPDNGVLRTASGRTEALDPDPKITPGRRAPRAAHNARLARMYALARAANPGLEVVKALDSPVFSDPDHLWGLSPFHYAGDYYAEIWRQLGGR